MNQALEDPEEPMSTGRAVASTVMTMASLGSIGTRVLAENGIVDIDNERWYSYRLRREIHEEAHKRFGDPALYAFGFAMGDFYGFLVDSVGVSHHEYRAQVAVSEEDSVWNEALSTFLSKVANAYDDAVRASYRAANFPYGFWSSRVGPLSYEMTAVATGAPNHEAFSRGLATSLIAQYIVDDWEFTSTYLPEHLRHGPTWSKYVWRFDFRRRQPRGKTANEITAEWRAEAKEALLRNVVAEAQRQEERATMALAELEKSHRLVMESIRYASLLQRAQLPRPQRYRDALPGLAVLWEPRDTIGGDLWWVSPPDEHGGCTLFVVDCTGHGVPGAMLALLASTTLERLYASGRSLSPAHALHDLGLALRSGLNQDLPDTGADSGQNDGCDAAAIRFDPATSTLTYAGANIDLIRMPAGEATQRVTADAFGLGYRDSQPQLPVEHQFALRKGDRLMLISDGVVDQVGLNPATGAKQAFGYRRLLSLLDQHRDASVGHCLEALRQALQEWQASELRRDDMTAVLIEL